MIGRTDRKGNPPECPEMAAVLTSHSYGKSRVRVTRVTRLADRHEVRELAVDVRLEGDFDASYTQGDNAAVIATDTMKNVVYALAQGRPAEAVEDFAAALAGHFLDGFAHVRSATVRLAESPWRRLVVDGREHPHAFISGGTEARTAVVTAGRDGVRYEAGVEGLRLLKTTGSGFSGFLRDRYTTLADAADRVFATEVQARWRYAGKTAWDDAFHQVRTALLETFARHDSLSVQQTLHAMGAAALDACPAVEEVTLNLPNRHHLLVDLERFGRENVNEVFVATDEPFGLITGTLRRG
jgi:urate oxidase